MPAEQKVSPPWLPPRWFIRAAWAVHRGIYRMFRGRVGLWPPRTGKWGTFRLTTVGRRTGRERSVILGYIEDGPNVCTLAMNGWGEGEPAWWLNVQAQPEVTIETVRGRRQVRGRAATGEERARIWQIWQGIDANLDAFAARRSTETAVVVFEPRT